MMNVSMLKKKIGWELFLIALLLLEVVVFGFANYLTFFMNFLCAG